MEAFLIRPNREINGGPRHKAGDKKCFHHLTPKPCACHQRCYLQIQFSYHCRRGSNKLITKQIKSKMIVLFKT